ncbi:GSU2403 family nucleotidyltransferase fold protein [Mesorhizobium sp. M1143]
MHRSGLPVLVPSPQRYAIHKLIVASRLGPSAGAKREKDLHQARLLTQALEATRRQDDLAFAFMEAWDKGENWRETIRRGLNLFDADTRETVNTILGKALREIGATPEGFTMRD